MAFRKLFNEFGGVCIRLDEGNVSEGVKLVLYQQKFNGQIKSKKLGYAVGLVLCIPPCLQYCK